MSNHLKFKKASNFKETHTCTLCKQIKSYLDFYIVKDKDTKSLYIKPRCKTCEIDSARNRNYLKRYGVTEKEVLELLYLQENQCFICSSEIVAPKSGNKKDPKTLNVDHCHISGKLRKLLCLGCNTGLGQFKDDKELLIKAAKYLEMFSE